MNRQYFGTNQYAYPSYGDQNRIGLRAVAAAIRYQGHFRNMERPLTRDTPVPAEAVTQTEERDA